MKAERVDSKFCLTLLVLGFIAIIRTNATSSDTKQDRVYQQQDLRGTEYTDNKVDGQTQEAQLPFYYNNNFDCTKHQYAYGMYADMDFQCQVYHVCHNNRKETFLCPHGTLFNQMLLVCDHWYSVNCQNTPSFYYVNEELGKTSNRSRFDSRDRPRSRFPQEYDRGYLPSHTTGAQGQLPPYYDRSTQSPYPHPPTEAPRGQNRFSNHTQSGRYHPQPQRGQTTSYGQLQPDQQNRLAPDYRYQPSRGSTQRQQDTYGQQRPGSGARGSSYDGQQPTFIQPANTFPGTQQNRDLVFTHYSQSGVHQTDQGSRTNATWPADQRNTSQGFHYGSQQQPSWRYGQGYPESAVLGARYGGQRSPSSQQHLPDRNSPGSPFLRLNPSVSQDGRLSSQVPTSGLTHDNQLPSSLHGQRSPVQHLDGDYTPSFPSAGRPGSEQTRQQQPQSGSPGLPHSPHHPFTTHAGQIHPQIRSPSSAYDHQQPAGYGQQPPREVGLGHGQQRLPFPSQYGQQPHFGTTGSPYGRQPSSLWNRQNQSYTTPPIYGQQPAFPDGRLSGGTDYRHQGPRRITGQGLEYVPQVRVQGNRTQLHSQRNFTTRFPVYQQHTPGGLGAKPDSRYPGQSLDRQYERKQEYDHGQSADLDKKQGSQYGSDSKAVQNPQSWSQPGSSWPIGNQPRRLRQETNSTESYKYSWQKPGNPLYSFQQPQYRKLSFSRDIATSQLAPGGDRRNSTGTEAQFRTDYNRSQDKNLKPILVYQHHIPANTGEPNKTAGREEVPVYKVYYVGRDRKGTAGN